MNSFEDDPELQHLLSQAMQSRKLEKDFQSLEQQIRCLKLRKSTAHEDEQIERTQSQQQAGILASQIDELERELASLHH